MFQVRCSNGGTCNFETLAEAFEYYKCKQGQVDKIGWYTDLAQYGRARWVPEWSHDAMKWESVDQIALVRPDLYKLFSNPHTNTKIWIHQTLYEFVESKKDKVPRIVSVLTESEFMCAYDLLQSDKLKRRKNGRSRRKLREMQMKMNI